MESDYKNPIGLIDSGLGGLSILREIKKLLPEEELIYFADSANCPYGTQQLPKIRRLVYQMVEFMLQQQCKVIVIACNSITAAFIEELRQKYPVLFVGIEPATLVAARNTKNGRIGILATKTTLESRLFKLTKNKISPRVDLEVATGVGLVELVEKGELNSKNAKKIIEQNLKIFKEKGVDQVVLGCTHYPFLLELMQKAMPGCEFIDPSLAVAKQLKRVLLKQKIVSNNKQAACKIYLSQRVAGLEILLTKIGFSSGKVKILSSS